MASRETSFQPLPRALTVAGFDPSGGAGVLADVRTFAAFGFRASAAITSITFQNSMRFFGAINQTPEAVRAQVLPMLDESNFFCAKIGMLPMRAVVLEVARLFRETALPRPVVDPVITSSSGQLLMEDAALDALIQELLPLAYPVTPNIPEAEALTGTKITSEADMQRAAAIIRELGAPAVLIKGGHLKNQKAEGKRQEGGSPIDRESSKLEPQDESDEAIDVLNNEGRVTVFRERRVSGAELHGSGCILSAGIAAGLGKGMTLDGSIAAAKSFVLDAIRNSAHVARPPGAKQDDEN
jgi:hydroxymethylpyrimidine/phosphomethylpyrimidine kinase